MTGQRPLHGARVAVTRQRKVRDRLVLALEREGASVIVAPLIRIVPPARMGSLRAAVRGADRYDWIAFTSATAVRRFVRAFQDQGLAIAPPTGVRTAAVGRATAAALADAGWTVSVVPRNQVGAALPDAMREAGLRAGDRVLWPCAENAASGLAEGLEEMDVTIDAVPTYRTVPDADAGRDLAELVEAGACDVLTFASPSAVSGYALGGGAARPGLTVAVIGPSTAGAARDAGLPVHVQPADHTMEAMVAALVRYVGGRPSSGE
jgi:uroporphyrinogen-III synthase